MITLLQRPVPKRSLPRNKLVRLSLTETFFFTSWLYTTRQLKGADAPVIPFKDKITILEMFYISLSPFLTLSPSPSISVSLSLSLFLSDRWRGCAHSKRFSFIQSVIMRDYYIQMLRPWRVSGSQRFLQMWGMGGSDEQRGFLNEVLFMIVSKVLQNRP